MTASPFLSVVMPVLNARADIGPALDSVVDCLTGCDFEVIVADGGSTDGTLDVLAGLSANVRLAEGPDRSLYEGLNKAIGEARGRYLLWLNADDRLASGAAALVRHAEKHGGALVTGEAASRRGGREVWRSKNGARRMSDASVLFGIPAINCRLMARDAVLSLGGFRTDIGLSADREMLYRLARTRSDRGFVPELAYVYGIHPLSRTLAGTWRSYLSVHEANQALATAIVAAADPRGQDMTAAAFALVSDAAAARAALASGRIGKGVTAALSAASGIRRPAAAAHAVRAYLANRGRSSGF